MDTVQIPRKLINQILEQAQGSPTQEVCGLIAGRDGKPTRCLTIKNTDRDPAHHFLLDPKQQIDAMRAMREQGEELFAIYHSHPDTPPLPSSEDLELAAYPEALYVVVSLGTTGTLQLRGFHILNKCAQAVDIVVD